MKRPKHLPAVDHSAMRAASMSSAAGVQPSKLIGQQPSPACRVFREYGCK